MSDTPNGCIKNTNLSSKTLHKYNINIKYKYMHVRYTQWMHKKYTNLSSKTHVFFHLAFYVYPHSVRAFLMHFAVRN